VPYFVYILQSERTGRYYVGSAANPNDRLIDHNRTTRGFTARHRPWRIVFKHDLRSKQEAQAVERRIKNWKSRTMIERLLGGEVELLE
jgi:putative endonuclease